jgi:hypothetical protein
MSDDPYEREAAKAAIHTLQLDLERCKEECANLKAERDEAVMQREYENRAISIARHYGYQDTRPTPHDFEDGRIRPARVLERAVAVALDAWVESDAEVTIKLCQNQVESWLAIVSVKGADATAFEMAEMGVDVESDVNEVWLPSDAINALIDGHGKEDAP